MSSALRTIAQLAEVAPRRLALGGAQPLDHGTLQARIAQLGARLQDLAPHAIALHADNSPEWIVADLAALAAGIPCLPLPLFFTPEQLAQAVASAGVEMLITDRPVGWIARGAHPVGRSGSATLLQLARSRSARSIHEGAVKITFTSGSTGAPRGACLGAATLDSVAGSLADLLLEAGVRSHLCLLPLPVLLENVAGVYASLRAGLCCIAPPLEEVGLAGSQGLDVKRMLAAIAEHRPDSIILLPQTLTALLDALDQGARMPHGLRFAAVGGAHVSSALLERADRHGLPVFEGYGLSECGSVVAVNRPSAHRPGSVGRPLPHQAVSIAADGEIHVSGPHFLGYLGEPPSARADVATGDIGHIDSHGFLHVDGRKGNLIISSFGRNISPEWVEGELMAQPGIEQCLVFGEARPHLGSLVFAPATHDAALDDAVRAVNERLPDYARIRGWLRVEQGFSMQNGQLTANGKPRRGIILEAFANRIAALYDA